MQSNALPPSRLPPSRLPQRAAGRFDIAAEASTSASRRGWDNHSADYQSEHGTWLLGASDGAGALMWCPQGWDEADVSLLGDCSALAGRSVVDIGTGGGQAAMWLANQGADVVGIDISHAQLTYAQLTHASAARRTPLTPNDSGVTNSGVTNSGVTNSGVTNS
ncbi:MAG: methyltransferase domain-containing protein, partial [Actinomycetes bacterium]